MKHALLALAAVAFAACSASVSPVDADGNPTGKGSISGTLRFDADIPKNPVRDEMGQQRDLLQVDPDSKGWAGVVVWLEVAEGALPSRDDVTDVETVVNQFDFAFEPGVVAVRAGELVRFTNEDGQNHNVRATKGDDSTAFNVTTAGAHDYETRFRPQPDNKPVRLSRDIHPWMRGWMYVFEHDWYRVTDTTGTFRFEGLPFGKYIVHIEQPDKEYREVFEVNLELGGEYVVDRTMRNLPPDAVVTSP